MEILKYFVKLVLWLGLVTNLVSHVSGTVAIETSSHQNVTSDDETALLQNSETRGPRVRRADSSCVESRKTIHVNGSPLVVVKCKTSLVFDCFRQSSCPGTTKFGRCEEVVTTRNGTKYVVDCKCACR